MLNSIRLSAIALAAPAALMLAAAPLQTEARGYRGHGEEIPFSVAELYFELNNTDGDLGIHSLIDGEPWKKLAIEDPRGRRMLSIDLRGRLRRQGLTELFFESAEPSFDELDPEDFFRRFPEGEYEIEGYSLRYQEMESTAFLSHVMPAPAGNIQVGGQDVPEDCDEDPIPAVALPALITWDPVTQSHPELGKVGPIEVTRYELILEREEPTPLKMTVLLQPAITEFVMPAELAGSGDEFKLEILVREANNNQTAVETCFIAQ